MSAEHRNGSRRKFDKVALFGLLFAVTMEAGALAILLTQKIDANAHEIRMTDEKTDSNFVLLSQKTEQITKEHNNFMLNARKLNENLATLNIMVHEHGVITKNLKEEVRNLKDEIRNLQGRL